MKRLILSRLAQESSGQRKKTPLILAAGGVGAVVLMLAVYWLITAHQTHSLRQQVFQVLPGASQVQHLHYTGQSWQRVALTSKNADSLYAGYDGSGQLVGYAIPGEGPGFQNPIGLLYGYQPEQRLIVGILVLDSGETSGWGEQALTNKDFLANFQSLAVDPKLVMVEIGKKDQPNEVDIMTGATISSQAIVQILNATNRHWLKRLPAVGSEPPLDFP